MIVEEHILLAPYTTLKVGGHADYFCSVETIEDLFEALNFAKERRIPWSILGGGSNLLVDDDGFPGLVIHIAIRGMCFDVERNGTILATAGAGDPWDDFVERCVTEGFFGVENLSGIPGSVGATPIQNVGAYGVEVQSVIENVTALDARTLTMRTFRNDECNFGYRNSLFKTKEGECYIILNVAYRLSTSGTLNISYKDLTRYFASVAGSPTLAKVREAVLSIRNRKFPDLARHGTAGSFFKNPIVKKHFYRSLQEKFPGIIGYAVNASDVKVSAAWLIDHIGGFRGVRRGAVGSFENQALVLVTYGTATAKEVELFAHTITKKIKDTTNIILEREVRTMQPLVCKH
jgi:UDP-N-acetylmuramate dehydrogenase